MTNPIRSQFLIVLTAVSGVFATPSVSAQDDGPRMTADRLGEIILKIDAEAVQDANSWYFHLEGLETAVVYDVARLVTPSDPKALQAWLKRLHVGLAHASNAEMTQVLKTAGASKELLDSVKSFQCHGCLSLRSPSSHHVSGKHIVRNFNDQLVLDYFFLTLEREGED